MLLGFKTEIKLNNKQRSEREFKCDSCGFTIECDLNAAINLSKVVS
ncbi:zinc ribbon domain-containing protein [Cylindrospermum sp. FACHB-282]|nr:transposase [Cylindrospermum sp. FACHB-282]